MSLISLLNDPFFSDFDRMFDEAFARRTGSQPQSVIPQSTGNAAPRVLRPKYVSSNSSFSKNLIANHCSHTGWTSTKTPKRTS